LKSTTSKSILFFTITLLIIVVTVVVIWVSTQNRPDRMSVDQMQIALEEGRVERASVDNDRIRVRFINSTQTNSNNYDAYTMGRDFIHQRLVEHNENIMAHYRLRLELDATDNNVRNELAARFSSAATRIGDAAGERALEDDENQAAATTAANASGYTVDSAEWTEYREDYLEVIRQAAFDLAYVAEITRLTNIALPNWVVNESRNSDLGWITLNFNDRFAVGFLDFLPTIFFVLLIVAMGVLFFRMLANQNKQGLGFSKNKSAPTTNSKVRFSDVAGAEEEKIELEEIVDFLKNPTKFKNVGARIPRGVLLVGPPGTGKTLFAKAVAGEANVPFFSISGSDFVEMFVGVGASRVRDLFENAKRAQPCIIFIDEIDAVGRQRGAGLGGGHDEREQTLNQLLVQMDGFESNDGIIVIAATNRADILDPALLRPGRFDRQIYVNVPDVRGREAIFKVHARNKPLDPSIDFKVLSRITSGMSGADIANILNEAAILCGRAGRSLINMEDITEGINKATLGPQKKSRVVTEFDKRVTAYHEAGHAICSRVCKKDCSVHEVSIIPRGGGAGGFTSTRPDTDDQMDTLSGFKATIAFIMGGRAAEALVIQDITTGASRDIQVATDIARRMVTEWGMSGNKMLGQVNYGGEQEVFLGRSYSSAKGHSDVMAAEIDKEIAKLVDEGYQTALTVLKKYAKHMDVMARVLLEHETIFSEEIDMIMNGSGADEVKAVIENRYKKPEVASVEIKADVFEVPVATPPTDTQG